MVKAGHHGWSGSWERYGFYRGKTFSVGIFKWVNGRKGLKKSAVIYRVKGYSSYPKDVYDRAKEICKLMDEGKWDSKRKSETVK